MRRIPLQAGSVGGGNGGIIIAPPRIPPNVECPECPEIPPIAAWSDIATVFDCAGDYPAGATIANGLFTATPGVDTSTLYQWSIDTTGMLVPYLCCVIPVDEAALIANFRFMTAGGAPIQTSPPANDILSPYFMLRPDGSSQTISAYQPNTSFGDAANGLVDAVTFRVQCIPVDPA